MNRLLVVMTILMLTASPAFILSITRNVMPAPPSGSPLEHGPTEPAEAHPVRFNTERLLDTDSVFHGIDRVDDGGAELPRRVDGQRAPPPQDEGGSDGDGAVTHASRISSMCSIPMERRTRSGVSPPAFCCSSLNCEWEVVEG